MQLRGGSSRVASKSSQIASIILLGGLIVGRIYEDSSALKLSRPSSYVMPHAAVRLLTLRSPLALREKAAKVRSLGCECGRSPASSEGKEGGQGDVKGDESGDVETWDVWGTEKIIALSEDQLRELDRMGWYELDEIIECLRIFKQQYGVVDVPAGFVVPSEDPWPMTCWELRFGEHLNRIRADGGYWGLDSQKKRELDNIGFDWSLSAYTWDDVYTALRIYNNATGDVNVLENFVVPLPDGRWPLACSGLKLGKEVLRLRRLKAKHPLISEDGLLMGAGDSGHPEALHRCQLLSDLGLFDAGSFKKTREEQKWELFLLALNWYLDQSGDVDVPSFFVIPNEDPWPLEIRGFPLGSRVSTVRSMGVFLHRDLVTNEQRIQELDNMGFIWETAERRWEMIIEALEIFKERHGHLLVPQDFVVPPLPDVWPEEIWGMKLGHRVNSIRSGVHVQGRPDRERQLTELGFEWDIRDVHWSLVVQCLEIWQREHAAGKRKKREERKKKKNKKSKKEEWGEEETATPATAMPANIGEEDSDEQLPLLKVPRSFVVPSKPPWPERAWGLPLGERSAKIRNRGDFIIGDSQRVHQLQEMNFFWGRGRDGGQRWLMTEDNDNNDSEGEGENRND
eukprot:jgi/Bigna1/145488/aug1.99_g20196